MPLSSTSTVIPKPVCDQFEIPQARFDFPALQLCGFGVDFSGGLECGRVCDVEFVHLLVDLDRRKIISPVRVNRHRAMFVNERFD
jgi:hypothetical protein